VTYPTILFSAVPLTTRRDARGRDIRFGFSRQQRSKADNGPDVPGTIEDKAGPCRRESFFTRGVRRARAPRPDLRRTPRVPRIKSADWAHINLRRWEIPKEPPFGGAAVCTAEQRGTHASHCHAVYRRNHACLGAYRGEGLLFEIAITGGGISGAFGAPVPNRIEAQGRHGTFRCHHISESRARR